MKEFFKILCLMVVVLMITCMSADLCFSQSITKTDSKDVVTIKTKENLEIKEPIGEADTPYTLGINDVIGIEVRNQPEFSGQYVVGPDGNIQYSYVGDIKAEGLSKYQLKDIISKELERYVRGAEITVSILAYRSKFVYMLGELSSPGQYPMKGDKVDLREAIFAADLPTRAAALRRVYVVTPSQDKPKFRKVDIYKLLYEGKLKWNIELAPGDVVVVPSTVPSEINRALTNLLSPFSQAANSYSLYHDLAQ